MRRSAWMRRSAILVAILAEQPLGSACDLMPALFVRPGGTVHLRALTIALDHRLTDDSWPPS